MNKERQLAKKLYISAATGKISRDVVDFFKDPQLYNYNFFNFNVRVDDAWKLNKTQIKDLLEEKFNLDVLFKMFFVDNLFITYQVASLHNFRNSPVFNNLALVEKINFFIRLITEVQKVAIKNGVIPGKCRFKYTYKGRDYYDTLEKKNSTYFLRIDGSTAEVYNRCLKSLNIVNSNKYTFEKCRDRFKINSLRYYRWTDYYVWGSHFYKLYTEVCEHYGVKSELTLTNLGK
jgi:hypothetical protein